MQTVADKSVISGLRWYAWPVRATNYGRWWLQPSWHECNADDVLYQMFTHRNLKWVQN